ncbi:translation initiation factor IF-2 [Rhodohalobacter sp. 614A]|uniref:translation initiation factor IF-2 n=1 Tax=Rhodohalobacter sp. 614A TaxID=2908649 RepID=UPI001F02F85C|nr:translation initiation factor IF-2 [Rhodohalobacter sp. 614A]
MTKQKPKKLFKVASEFNVATQSIVDTLSENGYDVTNRPNSSITQEMYDVLEGVYGDDKEKSIEHERAREEYESRRNQIMSSRNESVTIDSHLEPIEDLPLEPEEDPVPEPSLEPQEEEVVEAAPEEEEEISDEEEDEIDEPAPVEAQEQEDEAEELEEADEVDEPDEEEEEDEEEVTAEAEEDSDEDVEDDEVEDDEDEEEPEAKKEDSQEDEEEEVVRGRANKLSGTKVLGKVEFSRENRKKKKTRKRRKDRLDRDEDYTRKDKKQPKKDDTADKSSSKKTKKKKSRRSSKVDDEDVEKKMRETLQRIKEGDTVGSRRQKRRRQRKEEREEERAHQEELEELEESTLEVTEFITVSDLADLMGVKPNDVITTCMSLGTMVSINQRLDAATIELVAAEYDFDVEFVDAEEMIEEEFELIEDDPEDLEPRSPIITVMGHVDHGKTSLLDYIRKAKVAAGEAGGITQHVGAYEVETESGKKITFLDTPGHEAFTAMRSRGAQATDIVILVVAADDAVMPQTIEAINHAKAAGVSIVVAINKMDKEGANPDKIKNQLSEHGVIVEEYGGNNQVAEVSAHTGEGIDELLEKVLIEAELMELKANPNRLAQGVVLESRIDKGKGTVANILIQTGTLKIGDPFVAGPVFGRVRAMEDERGTRLNSAGPSTPVQLTGFDDTPQAGDRLIVSSDEKTAKEIANQRQQIRREQSLRKVKHLTLDDLSRRMALGEVSELNIIIKADVDGSIEALSGALQKLGTEEVSVNIIHTGSGAITESDVLLASASDAIIIGFQVRPTSSARKLAEAESIDIRLFSVIYDAVDEVHDALEGMLSPEIKEEMKGLVTVREVFRISRVGTIAGCYVNEGKVNRNNPIRIIRDGVVIYDGEIDSLKRFKEDVKEVQSGYECGISIEGFNDIKVGDEFESYEVIEEKRKLEDAR